MVTVHYVKIDDYHYFRSDDVIGLRIGSSDLHKAYHDVCPAIEILMEANHNIKCIAQPIKFKKASVLKSAPITYSSNAVISS